MSTGHPRRLWMLIALAAVGAAAAAATGAPSALDVQRESVRGLEVQLAGLDARTGQAVAAEQEAAARLAAARERLRQNAADLRRAAASHRLAQHVLADRLRAIYRQDQPDFLAVLLSTGGISEAVDSLQSLERVGRQDARIIRDLRAARARMIEAREAFSAQRRTARSDLGAAVARRRESEALATARRTVLIDARGRLSTMIAEEAQREAAARQAAAQAAQLAALRAAQTRLSTRIAAPVQAAAPAVPATGAPPGLGTLNRIALCESGGNPGALSPSGLYRGKYQFDPQTWRSVGGAGDPAAAPEAEQDKRAAMLYAQRGSSPWPVCGR